MNELWRRANQVPVTTVVAIAYLAMAVVTDLLHPSATLLIRYGAARAVDIADGEPWRLLSHAFLHGSWWHLGLNLWALVQLGPTIEMSIGSARFAALYVVGAIGGGLAGGLWHHPLAPLVGGSGALFAMLGALVALLARGGRDPTEFVAQPVGRQVLGNIAANLVIGMLIPFVSNAAHLGGLLTGFALTWWFLVPPRQPSRTRRSWQFAVAVTFAGALFAALLPVTRPDHLLLEWQRTPAGARRDALRAAYELEATGALQGLLDDATMAELVDDFERARRGR